MLRIVSMISALASAYRVEEEEEPGFDPVELAESVPDPVGWFYRFTLASVLIRSGRTGVRSLEREGTPSPG